MSAAAAADSLSPAPGRSRRPGVRCGAPGQDFDARVFAPIYQQSCQCADQKSRGAGFRSAAASTDSQSHGDRAKQQPRRRQAAEAAAGDPMTTPTGVQAPRAAHEPSRWQGSLRNEIVGLFGGKGRTPTVRPDRGGCSDPTCERCRERDRRGQPMSFAVEVATTFAFAVLRGALRHVARASRPLKNRPPLRQGRPQIRFRARVGRRGAHVFVSGWTRGYGALELSIADRVGPCPRRVAMRWIVPTCLDRSIRSATAHPRSPSLGWRQPISSWRHVMPETRVHQFPYWEPERHNELSDGIPAPPTRISEAGRATFPAGQ